MKTYDLRSLVRIGIFLVAAAVLLEATIHGLSWRSTGSQFAMCCMGFTLLVFLKARRRP